MCIPSPPKTGCESLPDHLSSQSHGARVAQLDRVTASEAAGCGFNSRHAHQLQSREDQVIRVCVLDDFSLIQPVRAHLENTTVAHQNISLQVVHFLAIAEH